MLAPWVNHHLRRTMRTGLSRLRVDRDIREAVLAHTRPGVEGVYDRHDYLDEKRDALERWLPTFEISRHMKLKQRILCGCAGSLALLLRVI